MKPPPAATVSTILLPYPLLHVETDPGGIVKRWRYPNQDLKIASSGGGYVNHPGPDLAEHVRNQMAASVCLVDTEERRMTHEVELNPVGVEALEQVDDQCGDVRPHLRTGVVETRTDTPLGCVRYEFLIRVDRSGTPGGRSGCCRHHRPPSGRSGNSSSPTVET